jgi:type II secretory pathway predicted ATPase ExeA
MRMATCGSSLARKAFGEDADKDLIFTYESRRAAHRYVSSALEEKIGIAILQGPHGAGKTTIINELAPRLKREVPIALFDGAKASMQFPVSSMLSQFGVDIIPQEDERMLQTLSIYLIRQARSGTAPILIIDNADRLEPSTLSLLNWLAALDVRGRWAMRFVLTGSERLADLIAKRSMRHFEHRHPAVFALNPLSKREAVIYLRTKWIGAGGENPEAVFSLDICENLHESSRGWPGPLNDLAMEAISRIGENEDKQLVPRIIVTDDSQTVAEYSVTKRETIIGRDKMADIVMNDGYVSKLHAILQLYKTGVVLLDLNSTNGTLVNSLEIMKTVLHNNDIIFIGRHRLKVEGLPAVSEEMIEKIRRSDTLIIDNPDDIRRSRAMHNIRRTAAGKESLLKSRPSSLSRPDALRDSEAHAS